MFVASFVPSCSLASKLNRIAITIFLALTVSALSQDAVVARPCTGCNGYLDIRIVLTGSPVYTYEPSSTTTTATPIKVTEECTTASFNSDGIFSYTGCRRQIGSNSGISFLQLHYSDQILSNVSILETILVAYTSRGTISFQSECITVSEGLTLSTPITINASNAYLSTYLSTMTSASIPQTTNATFVVLQSNILQSFVTTCRTPTAWLKAAETKQTAIQASPTFSLAENGNDGMPQSSRLLIGLLTGTSILTWLAFLIFFIRWRRAVKKYQVTSQSQAPSYLGRFQRFGSTSLRIPGTNDSEMKKSTGSTRLQKSWKAPLIMLTGLVCGGGLSIGHHLLYQSINGLPVDNVNTSQVWYLRSGNLFAMLIKLSYAISIEVAFVQVQWLKLHQVSTVRVKDVDTLSSVLSDMLNFIGNSIWLRLPSLTLVAVMFWLTALVPIFTPGTLDVQTLRFQNTTHLQVPQLDYSNVTQWTAPALAGDMRSSFFIGSPAMKQIVLATATGGQILPLSPYIPNGTYNLDFHGPAIKCYNASEDLRQRFISYYVDAARLANNFYYYAAKVNLWFDQPEFGFGALDSASSDYSRLWLLTQELEIFAKSSYIVTECGLFNARYHTQFSYQNGQQKIDVLDIEYLDGVSDMSYRGFTINISTPLDVPTIRDKQNQIESYYGLMAAFGSLLVGSILSGTVGKGPARSTSIDLLNFDYEGISSQELQSKLKELFQNITISLLSRSQFRKNSTQAEWIRVDDSVQLVSYVYDPVVLVSTYGLAFILTQLCVLLGLYAVTQNNGSYQNRFSTFLRATKNTAELRKYSHVDDDAADPRPKRLSKAMVKFSRLRRLEDVALENLPEDKSLVTEVDSTASI